MGNTDTTLISYPKRQAPGRPGNRQRTSPKKAPSRAGRRVTPLRACLERIRSAWSQQPPRIVTVRNHERRRGGVPATRRGTGMMARFLLLVRLEAGEIERRPTAFALAEAVRHIAGPFRKQAQEKGLKFRLNGLPEPSVMVYTDWSFLAHIIRELLANSVTFTREGVVTLTVEVQERTLRLRVSDTGVGIPETVLPAVFSGVHGLPASQQPGTGLALVWGLVHAMGGRVDAESEEGQGSTFTVTLPDVVVR